MLTERTNADRIRAGKILAEAIHNTDDIESIVDAVADLLHYAHSRGWDAGRITDQAQGHFAFEALGVELTDCAVCGQHIPEA